MEAARDPRWLRAALLGALLAGTAALQLHDSARDSTTADEPIHLVAGVVQVTTGTALVNVEHPPLAKSVYGWLAIRAGAPPLPPIPFRNLFRACRDYAAGNGDGAIVLAARRGAVAFFALALVGAYLAAGRGDAGLLAAVLLAGQTAVFPHGHLLTTDVPVTAFTLLAAGAARHAARTGSLPAVGAASLASALAIATKTTGLLTVPLVVGALLWGVRAPREGRRRRLAVAAASAAASLLLAAAVTVAAVPRTPSGAPARLAHLYGLPDGDQAVAERIGRVSPPLGAYAVGALFNVRQSAGGRRSYLLGEASDHPSAAYQLVAVAVKSPAAWLLLVAAGVGLVARGPERPFAAGFGLVAGTAWLLVSLPGPKIGVRHVFPAIGLLGCGAAAALAPWLARRGRWAVAGAVGLALSPLASARNLGDLGPLGHLTAAPPLADSNLDWGQDLLRLRDLLADRRIAPVDVAVAYFGGDVPRLRIPGVADVLEGEVPERRYLAVSRQLLLLGPQVALWAEGRDRLRAFLGDGTRLRGASHPGGAGASIELFDVAGGGRLPRNPGP